MPDTPDAPLIQALEHLYVGHYAGPRKQDWRTPEALFRALHDEYEFDYDGAAEADNALLPQHGTPDQMWPDWSHRRVFCNPPWSGIPPFVEAAAGADLAVLLVPARVNARWFHRALELGAVPRFFLGRPSFGGSPAKGHNSPVDCLLLVFGS